MINPFLLTMLLSLAAASTPPASCQEVSTPTAAVQDRAAAPGAGEVQKVVENTVGSLLDVLKDKANDRDARRRKIYAVMDSAGDLALMGKLTLGPEHWAKFSEAQRKEFTDAFANTIRNSCFEKVDIYTNETVEFAAPVPADKKKYGMAIYILSKGVRYTAIFKLYQAKSGWKVYDMEIEGVSLVRTYMAQFAQVLEKGSPEDLIKKLQAKAVDTPDVLKTPPEPLKPAQGGKP